ncbi:MAG: hypothetical protein WAQ25_04970 [Candidatus Saccharimonas sp.]
MKTSGMTATRLRAILASCLVALFSAGIGVFIVGYQIITDYSVATRNVAAEADASNSSLKNLTDLNKELTKNADVAHKASMIVSESKSYTYQNQITRDINDYATSAGITVTRVAFDDVKTTATAASNAATPSTTGTAAAPTAPSGVKSIGATITLKNPVDYMSMLKFINLMEQGLFKMRISQVSLSKSNDSTSPNGVTSDVLTVEAYIR